MCSSLKALICISAVALAIYTGIMFGQPYYKAYLFESDVRDMIRFELQGADKLKEQILDKAKKQKVPLKSKDLLVEGESEGFRARASWFEEVNILNKYRRKLKFSFDTDLP